MALNQGPIFTFDSAAPVSEQQADAVNQRLGRGNGISVAILPDDPQFSAVGAARELEFHLNRPGTIITRCSETTWGRRARTSTATCSAALVHRNQQVYNREGTVPALTGLIDDIEAVRDAPAASDDGGRLGVVLVTGAALVAASALALFGLRRARRP